MSQIVSKLKPDLNAGQANLCEELYQSVHAQVALARLLHSKFLLLKLEVRVVLYSTFQAQALLLRI